MSRADYLSHSTSVIGDAIRPVLALFLFCRFRPPCRSCYFGPNICYLLPADGRRPGDLTDVRSHPRPTEGRPRFWGSATLAEADKDNAFKTSDK